MTEPPTRQLPSLAGADWLTRAETRAVFDALAAEGFAARAVGDLKSVIRTQSQHPLQIMAIIGGKQSAVRRGGLIDPRVAGLFATLLSHRWLLFTHLHDNPASTIPKKPQMGIDEHR